MLASALPTIEDDYSVAQHLLLREYQHNFKFYLLDTVTYDDEMTNDLFLLYRAMRPDLKNKLTFDLVEQHGINIKKLVQSTPLTDTEKNKIKKIAHLINLFELQAHHDNILKQCIESIIIYIIHGEPRYQQDHLYLCYAWHLNRKLFYINVHDNLKTMDALETIFNICYLLEKETYFFDCVEQCLADHVEERINLKARKIPVTAAFPKEAIKSALLDSLKRKIKLYVNYFKVVKKFKHGLWSIKNAYHQLDAIDKYQSILFDLYEKIKKNTSKYSIALYTEIRKYEKEYISKEIDLFLLEHELSTIVNEYWNKKDKNSLINFDSLFASEYRKPLETIKKMAKDYDPKRKLHLELINQLISPVLAPIIYCYVGSPLARLTHGNIGIRNIDIDNVEEVKNVLQGIIYAIECLHSQVSSPIHINIAHNHFSYILKVQDDILEAIKDSLVVYNKIVQDYAIKHIRCLTVKNFTVHDDGTDDLDDLFVLMRAKLKSLGTMLLPASDFSEIIRYLFINIYNDGSDAKCETGIVDGLKLLHDHELPHYFPTYLQVIKNYEQRYREYHPDFAMDVVKLIVVYSKVEKKALDVNYLYNRIEQGDLGFTGFAYLYGHDISAPHIISPGKDITVLSKLADIYRHPDLKRLLIHLCDTQKQDSLHGPSFSSYEINSLMNCALKFTTMFFKFAPFLFADFFRREFCTIFCKTIEHFSFSGKNVDELHIKEKFLRIFNTSFFENNTHKFTDKLLVSMMENTSSLNRIFMPEDEYKINTIMNSLRNYIDNTPMIDFFNFTIRLMCYSNDIDTTFISVLDSAEKKNHDLFVYDLSLSNQYDSKELVKALRHSHSICSFYLLCCFAEVDDHHHFTQQDYLELLEKSMILLKKDHTDSIWLQKIAEYAAGTLIRDKEGFLSCKGEQEWQTYMNLLTTKFPKLELIQRYVDFNFRVQVKKVQMNKEFLKFTIHSQPPLSQAATEPESSPTLQTTKEVSPS